MDEKLLATLRAHNPWLDEPRSQRRHLAASLPEPFLARDKELELVPGRAELIVGPRQAGKSTWIRSTLAKSALPVLLLAAEEPRVRELGQSPALALDALRDVLRPDTLLFLEEVQHFPEAALFLKGLVDLDRRRRIIATGSTSFTLHARTRESLAGRVRRTRLLPFSLAEVGNRLAEDLVPALAAERRAELWERLLVTGGYPEAWLAEEPEEILRYLIEAIVLRDASDLHTIERPSAFRRVLELAAADVGNLVNLSDWAAVVQANRRTVDRYLEIAAQAHVLRLVPPFVGGKRAEVTSTPKVFFLDNGLRNALFGGFRPTADRPDRGALWENAVYAELLKRLPLLDEVRFWRSKNGAEVDFVVQRRQRLVAIEVKAGKPRRASVSRAGRSFVEAYRPACFGVINASLRQDDELDGVPVRFRRPWELDDLLAALD